MDFLFFWLFLLLSASLFALVEIQVEGDHGWAAKLPTWRIQNRWTKLILGEKPLTGYHFYINLFMLALVHLPYGLGLAVPSLKVECRILAFLILFWNVEDFLWFVFHPRFGLRRFRPEYIPWHAGQWWGICPREYILSIPLALFLYYLGYFGL